MLFCMAQNFAFSQCQSIFSTLLNVFEDVLYEYQDFRKEAAAVLFGETVGDLAEMSIDFQTSIYDRAMIIPGNGNSSIGPRYIYVDLGANKATGDLVTDRTFIAVPGGWDKTYITVTKTNGKAGADITACVKNDKGEMVNKKEKSIAKNSSDGKSVEFTFFGTEDKYITVHLVKTLGLNQFDYSIKMTGAMNEDKLEDELEEWQDENVMTGTNPTTDPNTTTTTTVITPKNKGIPNQINPGRVIKKNLATPKQVTPQTVGTTTVAKSVQNSSAASTKKVNNADGNRTKHIQKRKRQRRKKQ